MKNKGFTLVELLVVVTIIAILSVIGIALFGGVQKNSRDARRRADITSIAQALEVNKTIQGKYRNVADTDFSNGKIPKDPADTTASRWLYCLTYTNTYPPEAMPVNPTWTTPATCPTGGFAAPGVGYNELTSAIPDSGGSTTAWKVCALLDDKTTVVCKSGIY